MSFFDLLGELAPAPLNTRAQPELGLGSPQPWLVYWFGACQVLGGLGNLAVLLTVLLSPRVRRHAVWINFCLAWVVSTSAYLLLFVVGQVSGDEPDPDLCLASATLQSGMPVLFGGATLSLVLQLWFSTHWQFCGKYKQRKEVIRTVILMSWPYLAFITMISYSCQVIVHGPPPMRGASVYCYVPPGNLDVKTAIVSLTLVILVIMVELRISVYMYLHWHRFHSLVNTVSLPILLRLMVFSVFTLVAVATSLLFVVHRHKRQDISEAFLAPIPLEAFLIFGTQFDIFRAWKFWRTDDPLEPPPLAVDADVRVLIGDRAKDVQQQV